MKKTAFTLTVMMALLSAFAAFAAAPSYKVNPGDYLSIYVWNEESLVREVIIRPDGYISFPLVGEVEAAGQTTGQIELILAEALGKFLKDEPSVTVAPIELRGNKIYVLGKVNRPGEYPINRPTDVMQALALAGGLNTFGAENSINVLRRNADGQQHAIPFRYGDVKDGDELQTNIILQSGDVVVVP